MKVSTKYKRRNGKRGIEETQKLSTFCKRFETKKLENLTLVNLE